MTQPHALRADEAGPNAAEIRFWNSPATALWSRLPDRLDELFRGLTEVALERAAPRPGEHVVDIGCGAGASTLALARQVGRDGRVLGVDVAEALVAGARARAAAADLPQIEIALADASTFPFAQKAFDLAFSRFGIMFFRNPVEAFANVRAALKPDGRLVAAVFRPLDENEWVLAPYRAARALLPPPATPDPEAPGQFSFGDPDRVRRILEGAGFRDVRLDRHDPAIRLGEPGDPDGAAAFAVQLGPTGRALADASDSLKVAVRDAVAAELRRRDGPDGIVLKGAIWIVGARR